MSMVNGSSRASGSSQGGTVLSVEIFPHIAPLLTNTHTPQVVTHGSELEYHAV